MACSLCKKVKVESPTVKSGLPFSLASGITTVAGSDGRHYAIQTCLIPPMRQPRNGWSATFYIKGQKHTLHARPRDLFVQFKRLFDLNEVTYTDLELWFNLNLQWLEHSVERYQKVRYKDLFKLAIPNA
jgi:hypothetical protein